MEHVEGLFKISIDEMEKLISSKSVVGEPIVVNGNTIIPLLNVGFGFGAGGGFGKGTKEGRDGEGGGVKTVAVISINQDGVKVEPIPGAPSTLEKLGAAIGAAPEKRSEKTE